MVDCALHQAPTRPLSDQAEHKRLYRARNVPQRQRPDWCEGQIQTPMHVVAHAPRDADASRGTLRLQTGGDVHAVTMQVRIIRYYVANVDADPEPDASVWQLIAVVNRNLLLHLDRASHRAVDAVERYQQRVTAGLHHSSAALPDRRINQCPPQRPQAPQCAGVVKTNQTAVTDHVGVHYRDQPAATRGLAGEVRARCQSAHYLALAQRLDRNYQSCVSTWVSGSPATSHASRPPRYQ